VVSPSRVWNDRRDRSSVQNPFQPLLAYGIYLTRPLTDILRNNLPPSPCTRHVSSILTGGENPSRSVANSTTDIRHESRQRALAPDDPPTQDGILHLTQRGHNRRHSSSGASYLRPIPLTNRRDRFRQERGRFPCQGICQRHGGHATTCCTPSQ
jgi:hypothetical protein